MDRFIVHHRDRVVGTLSCFDRFLFKGHLPISHPHGLEVFFSWMGAKLTEFKVIALEMAGRMKEHAEAVARQAGRPYVYLVAHGGREEGTPAGLRSPGCPLYCIELV